MEGGAEGLVSLLADLCDQLELGQRRAQEALVRVRMGDSPSHRRASPERKLRAPAAERIAKQPQLAATAPPERPWCTRRPGLFLSTSSAGSCTDCTPASAQQAGPPTEAAVAPRSPAAVEVCNKPCPPVAEHPAEQPPPVALEPQETPRRALSAGCLQGQTSVGSGGVSTSGAAQQSGPRAPDGRPDSPANVGSLGEAVRGRQPLRFVEERGEGHSQPAGALPMVAPKRSTVSMWSTPRSIFVGSNRSMAPAASQTVATAAMDMIKHDTVRSYDLKQFWRSTSSGHNSYSGACPCSYIASRLPWSVRKWLSRFDAGPSPKQLQVRELVSSTGYEVCVMLLIMANSVFLGYQVEYEAYTRRQLQKSLEIEAVFCAVFVLELAVKVYAMSWSFCTGSEASWNFFDVSVVALMLLDFFVSVSRPATESSLWSQGQVLRVLRVLRVVRFLRSVRQLKFFMQIMIQSIMFSLRPLLWASTVLMGMFYVFGLILTQGAIEALKEQDSWDDESSAELRSYFGTLECTALSLFQAMSGGINWGELFEALAPLAVHCKCVFLFYVLFAIFGAANVVTGMWLSRTTGRATTRPRRSKRRPRKESPASEGCASSSTSWIQAATAL
ncbi:unnamed protein product [Prorocentrum cordatum]|uniref:Ion transport domain-containing protein n=1 Tax=Prorocentrum cordatum TaxID=2364126 RepID=A0ABN9UQZ5_9DINO|nr:unnamed protein product [Polarella glacialis]